MTSIDPLFDGVKPPGPMDCPYCGSHTYCDTVNNGLAEVQSGPYGCTNCGAVEMHWSVERSLTTIERRCGWSEPEQVTGKGVVSDDMTVWRELAPAGEGVWECSAPDCDSIWTFIDGGPTENQIRYCPGCGRYITAVEGYSDDANAHREDVEDDVSTIAEDGDDDDSDDA